MLEAREGKIARALPKVCSGRHNKGILVAAPLTTPRVKCKLVCVLQGSKRRRAGFEAKPRRPCRIAKNLSQGGPASAAIDR